MESNSGVLLDCDCERVKRSAAYKRSSFEISTPPRNAALFDSTSFQLMTVPTLTADISSLEARYVDSCKRHKLPSNAAVLLWLSKAMLQKSGHGQCKLVVLLHQLKDADFLPLVDMIEAIGSSAIDAVDILQESLSVVNEGYLMTLMRKINQKLHTVDLRDLSLTKDFLWDIFQGGLSCKVLKLNSSYIYKLDMAGRFVQLLTLNMDFCTHLTSLQKDCFSFMPNLRHLSMCETRVANLWTTSAALSRLPSLVELRFQNCLCCEDTGPCPTLLTDKISSGWLKNSFNSEAVYANRGSITHENEDQFDDNLDEISSHLQNISLLGLSSNLHCSLKNKTSHGDSWIQDGNDRPNLNDANTSPKNYNSHHPSPICFEKHYREFMVASLPRLEVLDNKPIRRMDRQIAKTIFSRYFEYLPYRKQHKESVVSVLHRREMGSGSIYRPLTSKLRKNQNYFSRSFCAAKLGSSTWPLLCPISKLSCTSKEGNKSPRPRQFEYHPSDPSLMAFGTLDGEVVILNHENRKIVAYMPSFGAMNCVLGLSWLRKYPSKVLAGSDSGF
ncbi:hypothetical protein Nepgr_016663 [Nepenthes gracilis]|uniref:U2A'/phosphoprotein 32 family A C-terminal domain-containing protein n=1 Tax=Nepenthes gracilis TaxID=150966 RepID=A0AAD3SQU3_NEPGR|nr:hypothetical protein Nepgr_016663 [Nepenthes gracilis]